MIFKTTCGMIAAMVLLAQAALAQEVSEDNVIVDTLIFPEGPLVAPDGTLYFCDGGANRVYQWDDGTLTVFAENTQAGNGLAMAPSGMYICQFSGGAFSLVELDGSITTLVTEIDGVQIDSPNDVVSDSHGNAYFTCNFRTDGRRSGSGVAYYGVDGTARVLIDNLRMANGIALSPDEQTLYVGDLMVNQILQYDLAPGLEATLRGTLVQLEAGALPDGIALHPDGSLYAALYAGGKVVQISPDGDVLREFLFPAGKTPTNVVFGGPESNIMYLTIPGAMLDLLRRTAGTDGTVDEQVERLREAGMLGKIYRIDLAD